MKVEVVTLFVSLVTRKTISCDVIDEEIIDDFSVTAEAPLKNPYLSIQCRIKVEGTAFLPRVIYLDNNGLAWVGISNDELGFVGAGKLYSFKIPTRVTPGPISQTFEEGSVNMRAPE